MKCTYLIEWNCIRTIDSCLGKYFERDLVLVLGEGANFFIGTSFLERKLIAREGQNFQAFRLILFIELLQLFFIMMMKASDGLTYHIVQSVRNWMQR